MKSNQYLFRWLQMAFCVFTLCGILFEMHAEEKKVDKKLTINIISIKNGKGLEKDYNILNRELTKLGHVTNFVDIYSNQQVPPADINLFLEAASWEMFSAAKKNYFIPNPELCMGDVDRVIPAFDKVLCKTKEAERIFNKWNNAQYIGFTSEDCFDPRYKKNYKFALHFSGSGGDQKGTNSVEKLWLRNPDYPPLILIKRTESVFCNDRKNVNQINGYLPNNNLVMYLNIAGLHLAPSITEGFGHTLFEGMSTEAVLVTTDAPPMNEFVTDPRCLVGYDKTETQHLATCYHVGQAKFAKVIENLLGLSEDELKKIGEQNRQNYLKKQEEFRKNLAAVFNYDAVGLN
jgi:hypothetical protein